MSGIEIDGSPSCYDNLEPYLKSLKGVSGVTCEVGVRRGGGTHFIIKTLLENDDKRPHICIDPYGTILYNDIAGKHRTDYTNQMRNETMSLIFKYAFENDVNLLFFNMEDSEFYKRFEDGVPIYEIDKTIQNEFAFVHIDGQHDLESVKLAADYFINKIPSGGLIAFDNTDHYEHSVIDELMISAGFEFLENIQPCSRIVYRKNENTIHIK